MFDRLRKALHLPGGPNAARPVSNQEVVRWAATQRLAVVPQAVDGHFDLGGDLNGHPWRLECGNPTRDYVRGLELRGRADLGVDPDAAVMVLNRPLQESLEGNAYNAITDTLQTTVNASLPEEMRWLAMFEEVTWPGLPASFRQHFAVVAERIETAQRWIHAPVVSQLLNIVEGEGGAVRAQPPLLLMLVRGKVQQAEGITHLIGEHLEDITADLALLSRPPLKDGSFLLPADSQKTSPDPRERPRPMGRHPRDVRVLPKSRDFH